MNDSHARFEELAAGHALWALEPGDEQLFLEHLRTCSACERAVAEHRETAAHLAYAADPVDLPDGILAGIRAGVQASGRAMDPPAAPAPPTLEAARERRRLRTPPPAWIGVAAAAVLVLALGGWNLSLQHRQSDAQQRAERLASAVRLLETGPRVTLSDDSGRAVAVAVMRDASTMTLVVDGLPRNDTAHSTYVLWQTGATGTKAVGAFDVTSADVQVLPDMKLVTTLKGWSAFAVTREPGRTAPEAPGSLPVANGPLPA